MLSHILKALKQYSIILLLFIMVTGCKTELYHGLTESQANELILVLNRYGITARKKRESGRNAEWVVSVSESDAGKALKVIFEYNLPTETPPGFNELFQKDSFLPTNIQEQTRFLSALTGELQKTLEKDDSVIKARVHIYNGGIERSNRRSTEKNRSAAVLLKTAPYSNRAAVLDDDAVKSLIAASVGAMSENDVTVIRTEGTIWYSSITSEEDSQSHVIDRHVKFVIAIAMGLLVIGIVLVGYAKSVMRQKKSEESQDDLQN